jgi:hypothetical protein
MFLITLKETPERGAFSVTNEKGNKILYLFQQSDDALRFSMQLEENGYPKTEIVECEDRKIIYTCELTNTKYAIIKPEDLVVPPVFEK